jgi:hypothetical protein
MTRNVLALLLLTACASNAPDNAAICRAAAAGASHVEVVARGTVTRLLGDASTHEGVMMRLSSDCAETLRVEINTNFGGVVPLRAGQSIIVKGEYETDPDGGVIHWTHFDPRGHHDSGFVQVGMR